MLFLFVFHIMMHKIFEIKIKVFEKIVNSFVPREFGGNSNDFAVVYQAYLYIMAYIWGEYCQVND